MTDQVPAHVETPAAQGDVAPVNTDNPNPTDAEQTTAQPPAGDEGKGNDEERKSREKQSRFDRKIGQLKGENSYLKRELASMRGEIATLKQSAPQQNAKPTRDNFQSEDDFLEALTDWKLEQRFSEVKKTESVTEQKRQVEQQTEKARAVFQEREAQFAAKTADYDDVVEEFSAIVPRDPNSNAITNAILQHEKGPEILYAVAKDPELAGSLYAKHPSFAAATLNKIAATLGRSETPQKQQLPDPPSSVKPAAAKQPKALDDLSGKELLKFFRS